MSFDKFLKQTVTRIVQEQEPIAFQDISLNLPKYELQHAYDKRPYNKKTDLILCRNRHEAMNIHAYPPHHIRNNHTKFLKRQDISRIRRSDGRWLLHSFQVFLLTDDYVGHRHGHFQPTALAADIEYLRNIGINTHISRKHRAVSVNLPFDIQKLAADLEFIFQ